MKNLVIKFIDNWIERKNGYKNIEVDPQGFGYYGVPLLQMKHVDYVKAHAICLPLKMERRGVSSEHTHPEKKEIIWGKVHFIIDEKKRMDEW